MGAASSVSPSAVAMSPSISSQFSADDHVMCSQTVASGGSAEPILAVYIYADSRDTIAHSAAIEFVKQHMPCLCDMAASRGVCMLSLPVETEEQILDAYNAAAIFSERCSHALVIFASDSNESGPGLPAQLPLAFVQRCIATLKKSRPEAAEFVSHTLNVFPRSSFTSCCAHESQHADDAVTVPTYNWFTERMQLCLRHTLFEACAEMNATLEEMKPILLSRIASVMATWLEITGSADGAADANCYSAAVFFVKNEDASISMPPLPEQPPAPSQMNAAKMILSNAFSRVSLWARQKAGLTQQQDPQVLASQEFPEPRRYDSKRVPRSQRLAEAAEEPGSAVQVKADAIISPNATDHVELAPPPRQKKSKSRKKASAAFASDLPESLDAPALDPLGVATEPTSSSHLPPLQQTLQSASRHTHTQQTFQREADDEPAVGVFLAASSSRRKVVLKDPKNEQPRDTAATATATEGRRRKSKSSSSSILATTESIEKHQAVGTAALSSPLHTLDELGMHHRGSIARVGQERAVRFADDASVDASTTLHDSAVDGARGSKAGYSSSNAHSSFSPHSDVRWSSLLSQASRMHDCEHIARKLPQHFVVQCVCHSIIDPCTPRLLQCAGAHTWHILARAAHNSLHPKHSLLQELWSHRQLIVKRPPLGGQSAARDHILGHCMVKGESMPLVVVGAAGFGKTSMLASVVAHLMQEKHSTAYSKIKLPAYAVFRSIGVTELGFDPVRLLDSILLEIYAVVERKPTLESVELVPHHDCVLRMSDDALDATMHRLPAHADIAASRAAANWRQLASTLQSLPRGKPIVLVIDNAHAIMSFAMWTRVFAAPLPPHVKVILSFAEEAGTLESVMAEIASLPAQWPIYQLSSIASTDALLALQSISSAAVLHNSLVKHQPARACTLVASQLTAPEPLYRLHMRYMCALADSLRSFSADDVFDFLVAVSCTHNMQALVVMLCVLLACPSPCGISLNVLLEVMHHIYSPPPPPEELPSAHHQSGHIAAVTNAEIPTSPSSPDADTFSSPPLMKRSAGSPFYPANPIPHNASPQGVARSITFDAEEKLSAAAVGNGQPHRSVVFLLVAACIKPVLAITFVAATPSLSLAGAHVHDGCQRFLKQHVMGAHPFFSAVETTLQGVIDLSRSVINSVYRRNSAFLGWKRRVDADSSLNTVEAVVRPLMSLYAPPSHLSAESSGIRDVTSAAMCCDSLYFFAVCQTAGASGVLESLAAANAFCMSPQFWSGQTSQPSTCSLHRVASAMRIAGIIRPLVQRYSRTARFPAELLFALLSSSADACIVHWACCGLSDMNALHPGSWHPIAYLPLPKKEPEQEPGLLKRLFKRMSRIAPASETSQGPEAASSTVSMTFMQASARLHIANRSSLSSKSIWWRNRSREDGVLVQSWVAMCHLPGSVKTVLFDDVTMACSCSDATSSIIRILRITNRGAEVRNEFPVHSPVLCLCVVELAGERAAAGVSALATGCQDGVVRIWRHISGSLLMSLNALQGHPVSLLLFAASNSARAAHNVIAGSSSGAICSWGLTGTQTAPIMSLPAPIVDMHILPVSDKLVVFGNDSTVRFLRVRDLGLLSTITLYNVGVSRALASELPGDSKSRDLIIAGSIDGTISVHSQMHLLIAWPAHKGQVSSMSATQWSSDSSTFNRRCFIVSAGGDHRLRVWLVELRQSDEDRHADALPLLSAVCIFGAVCSAAISNISPPQSCLIANSNFSPPFPSSIAGQENVAPASCVLLSFADGSVAGYRLPLALTPSGAWDKVQGSVLCLASDGNEILAIGLSSGHVMIFDRHDMRAVFCSQSAQVAVGSAVVAPSKIQLHTCGGSGSSSRVVLVLARFSDGSLRVWKLLRCALPGVSAGHAGRGFLNSTEAPMMRQLQYCEAHGAGGGSKIFCCVNDTGIISLDGDKLIRMWGLFGGSEKDTVTCAQPRRILIGADSLPIALFALQDGRLVGAVCVTGAVVVWAADSGSVVFKGSMTAPLSSSTAFEAHVVQGNGDVRIVASHVNVDSGLHVVLYELNCDGVRPELKCVCSTDTVGNGPDSLTCAYMSSCSRLLLLGFKSGLLCAWLLPRSRLYTLFKAHGPLHSVVCWHLIVAPHIASPYERRLQAVQSRAAAFAVSFETTHGVAHTIAVSLPMPPASEVSNPPHPFSDSHETSTGSLLLLHHGCHSHVFPADIAVAGGACAAHDGSAVMTLHRGGSIVGWSECKHGLLTEESSRFRAICCSDCPAATALIFVSPKVVALACTDSSVALWHVVDGKRGLSWKAHSSGVCKFLQTNGPPDGLSLPGLFTFSRSGVGQLWNMNNGTALLAWQAADAAIVTAGFVSPGRIAVVSADAVVRVFEISNERVERETILQQPLQRFPAVTHAAMHAPSGIIAAANEGVVVALTLSLSTKSQSLVMFAKRASPCLDLCFTSSSGRLAAAHQDGFIYVYKVEVGIDNLNPRVCCVCAHDAPVVALCHVPLTDDIVAADESGCVRRWTAQVMEASEEAQLT